MRGAGRYVSLGIVLMSIIQRPDSEKHETKTREVFAHSTENAVRRQSVTNYKYAEQRDGQDTE
ncbi:hypothetical protein GQ600_7036 [Phytophthora cactorum]|nr:hypothetical protein GQ600_7036 [Phytophthora cactorum]